MREIYAFRLIFEDLCVILYYNARKQSRVVFGFVMVRSEDDACLVKIRAFEIFLASYIMARNCHSSGKIQQRNKADDNWKKRL